MTSIESRIEKHEKAIADISRSTTLSNRKQSRLRIDERNVVYMLTTTSLEKERRYIFGKAQDLTSRLSTYNKSDEHIVRYYRSCADKETMGIVENMVMKKLEPYREQSNRERFVLPEGENIEMFTKAIDTCVDFL